jgi:hypothetical protein
MRQIAGIALGIALLAAGCNHAPYMRRDQLTSGGPPPRTPTAPELVKYLNDNAQQVQSVQASVHMEAQQDRQPVSLGGFLACQKPRNFRLKASVMSQPAVDIGSNDDEFWYWISKADPPYVFHCSYRDLARPEGVRMPFPFQPDMIIMALGVGEYNTDASKYQVQVKGQTLELIEDAVSPQGQPVKKVTIFNRYPAKPPQPQVLGYVLRDKDGKDVCRVTVQEVEMLRSTLLPREVTLVWPEQRAQLKMSLSRIQTNPALNNVVLFQRSQLRALTSFDLARWAVDNPQLDRTGPQRASFQTQSRQTFR